MKIAFCNTILALVGAASFATAAEQTLRGRRLNNSTIVGGEQQTTPISFFVHFGDGSCGGTLISPDTGLFLRGLSIGCSLAILYVRLTLVFSFVP